MILLKDTSDVHAWSFGFRLLADAVRTRHLSAGYLLMILRSSLLCRRCLRWVTRVSRAYRWQLNIYWIVRGRYMFEAWSHAVISAMIGRVTSGVRSAGRNLWRGNRQR